MIIVRLFIAMAAVFPLLASATIVEILKPDPLICAGNDGSPFVVKIQYIQDQQGSIEATATLLRDGKSPDRRKIGPLRVGNQGNNYISQVTESAQFNIYLTGLGVDGLVRDMRGMGPKSKYSLIGTLSFSEIDNEEVLCQGNFAR